MDSDDDLPCIKFSCSKMPPKQKNNEASAAFCEITEHLSDIGCEATSTAAESSTCDMVVVDLDSSDSDSWRECTLKCNRNLRERCNMSAALSSASCAVSCSSQLDIDLATASATDDQSCGNSVTDSSSMAWKSYENSEEFASQQLSQTTTTDVNSQTSVESDDKRRRKRPNKAEDPEAVARKVARQAEKERRQREKEEKKLKREEEKRQRELMKQEMNFEKTRKRLVQETLRNARPGECMKHIIALIDSRLVSESCGVPILTCLSTADVRYEVGNQIQPYIISFSREQAVVKESEAKRLETKYEECVDDEILLYLPLMEFLKLVDGFQKEKEGFAMSTSNSCSLPEFVRKKKSDLGGRNLTVLVQGIDNYFRQQKTEVRKNYRSKVVALDNDGELGGAGAKSKTKSKDDDISVSMITVEEALLAVQLDNGCCVKFVENDVDLAKMVLQYTKAVAERPYKQGRMQTSGFSMFVDGGRGTRVSSDGTGLMNVWRQQLMQFKNVSVEVSNAIIARYPSPRLLYDAYKSCNTEKEAETLLENIEVRRGAGVIATVRRVGKELSRRLCTLMTSNDPQLVIR